MLLLYQLHDEGTRNAPRPFTLVVWAFYIVQCPLDCAACQFHSSCACAGDRCHSKNQPSRAAWLCNAPSGRLAWQSLQVPVQVQVIVATAATCWGMSIAAHLVVIMGTQYYDGAHSQGADDYPVTDLLQMMGRASRPDIDDSGKWVVLLSPALPCLCVLDVVILWCFTRQTAACPVLLCQLPRLDFVCGHAPLFLRPQSPCFLCQCTGITYSWLLSSVA